MISQTVPLASSFTLSAALPKAEPKMEMRGNMIVFSGSELLQEISIPPSIGGVASTVPRGGTMALQPLNPFYSDGLRVAYSMKQYDQFRIVRLVFEYLPTCPATQAGGIAMAVVNDPADTLSLATGFSALRDLLTRDGSTAFSPYVGAVATAGAPLLKWFFTQSLDNPELTVPGQIEVVAATDFSNGTVNSIPLGLLYMHYEFQVRAPSIEAPLSQNYYTSTASLGFNAVITNDAYASIPTAGMPTPHQTLSMIGWGIIVSCDDVAAGSSAWRSWTVSNSGEDVLLQPGNVLFWRNYDTASVRTTYFFPSLAAAMNTEVGASGYQYTSGGAAIVRGFKVWNVQGVSLI